MPKYQEDFKLNVNDIAMIEQALRTQVRSEIDMRHCETTNQHQHQEVRSMNRNIQSLLGKINHQKIFYSEVNSVAHPRG